MKKSTKSSASPAPAKKTAKTTKAVAPAKVAKPSAPAKVAKATKPAVKPVEKVAVKPAAKTPAKKTPAIPAVEVKKAEPAPVVTTIIAEIDVGFGNGLYVRGEGPGLSWEKGVLLDCKTDDQWSLTLPETARPVIFKFLLNDNIWSAGEDYSVQSGQSVTLVPQF